MAGGGGEEELNLIPYMDIIVTLVLCMVFTVSLLEDFRTARVEVLEDFRTARVEVPVYDGKGASGEALNVVIAPEGFEVRQGGAVLALPREGGDWPYEKLASVLRGVRDAEAEAPRLTVSPEAAVPYKIVVATLDALRTDAQGDLFPSVALGIARR